MHTLEKRSARVSLMRTRPSFVQRLWSFSANSVLVFILIFLIVYALNVFSERSGSIIKVVESAKSANFSARKKDGLPVMQLELGKRIEYDVNWYYLEGGCDTRLRLEFDQVDPGLEREAKSTVVIDMKGRALPIGSPGFDHISRPQPVGLAPGLWRYTSTLIGVCANGRKPPPEKVVDFYLDVTDPKLPAFQQLPPFEFLTPTVKNTDHLRWRYNLKRNLDGKAVIIYTLISKNIGVSKPDAIDLYVIQRPAGVGIGTYPNLDVDFDLPDSIHPGEWGLAVTTVTNLPSGRIQTDTLFDTTFEVTP